MHPLSRLSLFGVRMATLLLVVYWLLIFTGTHLPKLPAPSFHSGDKVYHFSAFVGLSFLLAWAIPLHRRNLRSKLGLALLVAVCYGVLDEWTQSLVPGRSSEMLDFAADCGGAVVGVLTYWIARKILVRAPDPDGRLGCERSEDPSSVQERSAA